MLVPVTARAHLVCALLDERRIGCVNERFCWHGTTRLPAWQVIQGYPFASLWAGGGKANEEARRTR